MPLRMKDRKEFKISYLAAHLTTIVSVTLVLLMIGIIAFVGYAARRETHRLQEQVEVSVVLQDSIPSAAVDSLSRLLAAKPYAARTEVISREQAMREWNEETGENLEEVLGVNPFSPEISVSLRAGYASPEAIKSIAAEAGKMKGVSEVAVPDASMVESMNRNIAGLAGVLGVIAAVMLIISFVLINNTVRLSIYARRFTIHTMQLVGATDAFIRRPFLRDNLLNGIVSGLAASAILGLALWGMESGGMTVAVISGEWQVVCAIAGGLTVAGAVICVAAAAIATRKYLHADYGELFRS